MTTTSSNGISASRNIRNFIFSRNEKDFQQFCTMDNYEDAIVTLFEELDAFDVPDLSDIPSKPLVTKEPESADLMKCLFVKLMNSAWNLIHQHRSLMKNHEKLKEQHSRVLNDNTGLTNQVRRLKEAIGRKENHISEVLERERQLKVKLGSMNKDLKREKEETVKLKKQIQSKDIQHAHEIRRIQQSGNKLREQLQKTVGTYVPKNRAAQQLQTEYEDKIRTYKQTINRLEENNGLMLQEINELKDALDLHAGGLALHVESSGIWDESTS
ncbi:uncharacterized protein [Chelonus insularis]|uniref:uncharacterized protein n=1 Tax=Chelonus insularis TaxID=460826 RepID=UPI00158D4ECF|nr:uncharacterized protein LOC118072008 [Chelonus insularis]